MREPVEHELKVLPQFYKEIRTHRKTFEIRRDDRDYQVGDTLRLREWDGEGFTGGYTRRAITYILRDAKEYGLKEGYCILGLHLKGWNDFRPQVVLDEEVEEVTSHSEARILRSCISLMSKLTREFGRWYRWQHGDSAIEKIPVEERFGIAIPYSTIVQELFLSGTRHSGGTSTRIKCAELGVDAGRTVQFDLEED